MLHRIANPYHLKTLFELLLTTSNKCKLKILAIFRNLFKVKIPERIFNDALTQLQVPLTLEADSLVFNKYCKSDLGRFLYTYAAQLSNADILKSSERTDGNYEVVKHLIKTLKLFEGSYDNMQNAFLEIEEASVNEQALLMHYANLSFYHPSFGDQLELNGKFCEDHIKHVSGQDLRLISEKECKVTYYDSLYEKVITKVSLHELKQPERDSRPVAFSAEVTSHLESLLKDVKCPTLLKCYLIKYFLMN